MQHPAREGIGNNHVDSRLRLPSRAQFDGTVLSKSSECKNPARVEIAKEDYGAMPRRTAEGGCPHVVIADLRTSRTLASTMTRFA
jgi:hypothetical protein